MCLYLESALSSNVVSQLWFHSSLQQKTQTGSVKVMYNSKRILIGICSLCYGGKDAILVPTLHLQTKMEISVMVTSP